MQVELKTVNEYAEEKAVISAVEITEEIQSAVDILENNKRTVLVIKDGENILCETDKIYYIESVDKKTFVYTKEACYESRQRLYELEDCLSANFIRCAKAMIVNIKKINSVKSEINGRMTAELLNKERIVIARNYVKNLKERLGI